MNHKKNVPYTRRICWRELCSNVSTGTTCQRRCDLWPQAVSVEPSFRGVRLRPSSVRIRRRQGCYSASASCWRAHLLPNHLPLGTSGKCHNKGCYGQTQCWVVEPETTPREGSARTWKKENNNNDVPLTFYWSLRTHSGTIVVHHYNKCDNSVFST